MLEVFDKTFAITYSLEIIAILVAVLGLFNTLVSLILERKREIGILRFIGAFKGQVKRMVLIEAGILGLIGSVMGFIAGVIVSYILIFVINKQSFGWTIQVHFPYLFILIMVTMFWGVSILSGLYPPGWQQTSIRKKPCEWVTTKVFLLNKISTNLILQLVSAVPGIEIEFIGNIKKFCGDID